MTYLEKYLRKHPDEKLIEKIYWDLCPRNEDGKPIKCPFSGKTNSELRNNGYCTVCWHGKIPEENDLFEPCPDYEESLKNIQGPLANAEYVPYEKIIKDSGERREFETGAVRDIQKGKGRCDLMPLGVVSYLLDDDYVLLSIDDFQTRGDVKDLYNALDYFIDTTTYPDLSTMLLEVSKHFEAGAEKYGEYNWQKGIPTHCYIDSAVRHYLKYLRDDQDEPHDRAFVWNILCCIWTCINKPELDDYRKDREEPSND